MSSEIKLSWLKDTPLCHGNRLQTSDGHILSIEKQIGIGTLSVVYEVIMISDPSLPHYALKLPLDHEDSQILIQFEADVLHYVCIYLMRIHSLEFLLIIKDSRVCFPHSFLINKLLTHSFRLNLI